MRTVRKGDKEDPEMSVTDALVIKHFYGTLHPLSELADEIIVERACKVVNRWKDAKEKKPPKPERVRRFAKRG